jgi:NAD(P)-dependent dehydrogenase (short-subunit alcohol dehydrogenase family)
MTDKRVWFITGAGRGMGVEFAKAALAAGNAVVATGRDTDAQRTAVGEADDPAATRPALRQTSLRAHQTRRAPVRMPRLPRCPFGSPPPRPPASHPR